MKFCPQCGANFEQGARFCQECGFDAHTIEPENQETSKEALPAETDLPEVASNTAVKCRQCGSAMGPDDRFCEKCGADNALPAAEPLAGVVAVPAVAQPEPLVAAVDEPVPAVQQPSANAGGFCEECGSPMEEGSNFCEQCGANMAQSKAEPVAEPVGQEPGPPLAVVDEPVPVAQQPPANSGGFCEECGSPMTEGSIFCEQCGHKNGEEVTPAPPPVQETKAAFTPPPVAPPPPPPAPSKAEKTAQVKPVSPVQQADKKSRKGILLPVLIVAGVLVLGAGGWFAWDKFLKKSGEPVADTAAVAVVPEAEIADDFIVEDTARQTEVPVAEPVVTAPVKETTKPAANRQNTQKKTPPAKKATEPKKTEPTPQEPAQTNEPLKVKIKPSGSKSGRTILSIHNNDEAKSGPLFASKLKLDKAFVITKITTYHHNWGKGAQPGTIALQRKKETFGPWQAKGVQGDDGTPNGKWICEPNVRLEEGTYKVEVSDEKSWSYNGQSGQKGFVVIEGYEAD